MRRILNIVLILSVVIGLFGLTPANVVKAQTPNSEISVALVFSPETIAQQAVSRLTITLSNANTLNFTNTTFNLNLPADLVLDDPVSLNNTCGGTAVATAGLNTFSISGGTIPGAGTCTYAINIGATLPGNKEFTIASGAITGYLDADHFSNLASASDTLNVANFDFNAEINKQFNPLVINPGDKSNMRVSIYNSNTFQLEDASWEDNLPSGLFIANPPNIATIGCGSSIIVADNLTSSTLTAGGSSLTIRNATVSAQVGSINGECRVSVDVTSNRSGENLINIIPGGELSATGNSGANTVSNTDESRATLTVRTIDTPSISKGFAPSTIWVGENSRLTINIHNDDTVLGIDTVSLTDNLPVNVVLAPTVSPTLTNCGSSANLTAASGTGIITINNAEIAANGTCVIQVNVTSTVQGEYTNTIPIGAISSRQGVTNDAIAEDQLNVQAVSILKSISPSSILAGDEATLTITLRNPSSIPYTNTTLSDILPNTLAGSNLYYTGTPSTTCAGGLLAISTTNYADDTLTLTGATVPSGTYSAMGTCTITATLTTADTALTRSHTNTIGIGALDNDQHVTNPMSASANLSITAQTITVVKSFSPPSIQQGGLTTVSIQFRNPTSAILHITSFTDELPAGLVPEGTAVTTCVNGEASTTYDSGTGRYSLVLGAAAVPGTGAEIPAGTVTVPGTCTVSVPVRIATAGTYTNTVPINAIDTEEDITNLNPDSEDIVVYPTGLGMTGSKVFNDDFVLAGSSTRLRITLNAPADTLISNLGVTDNLPANLLISNSSPASTTCGGTLTATTGASSISLTGGSISQGGSCRIDVYVTSTVSDTYTNTVYSSSDPLVNNITNNENRRPAANLSDSVTFSHLTMAKAFYPNIVAPNGRTTVTITLTNRNDAAITGLSLTDNMSDIGPGSFFTIASTPNARTTCPGGTATATAGSQLLSLTNATIPAQVSGTPGICTVSVDVVASGTFSPTPWTRDNTVYRTNVLGSVAGTPIRPVADAQAAITVRPLAIGVVKGFDPLTVFGGSSSTMTITLINENTTVLTGIAFTDTMPVGMYLANPVNANVGTCGGEIIATPGAQTFRFEGGVLPANKQCSLTLNATMNVHGNRTNTIPVGAVTTFNGASNTQAAQASLTNLPGASVTKFFTPNEIVLGEAVLLTIQLKNTGNIPLSNVGFTDTLPPGITIAASPAPTNACNGILSATPGSNLIQLGAGSIAAGPNTTCNIVVPVEASGAGIYTNTIGVGNVTSSEGATNTEPAEDTLTVKASPSLQLVKSFIPGSAPYDPGETLNYSLVATNTGDINLTNVTITDNTIGMSMGTCTPNQPATLAPGASMTCPASHIVTAGDVTAGTYVNTASADSDQTEPVSDDVTVPINAGPALGINKVITTAGPYELGDSITYQITATNIGTEDLNNVTVNDPDVTLGACTPSQPATLAVGAAMICPATYIVRQADVNVESFTNTATADSDETTPVTDSVTIPIVDNARLDVYKQVISTGPYNFVGAVVTYDISAVNNGDQTLTNVVITDTDPGVTLGTCTPAQPATLTTGQILSCEATYAITNADLTAGGFTNTAFADSDQTDLVSDTAEVVTLVPTIQLEKTGTRADTDGSGDASAGDVVSYVFTVTNTGQVTLNNIRVTDLVGGVTISGGPPISLAPGASDTTTFTGSYTLTQADVNAGTFTNTASVVGTPVVGSIVSDLDDDTQTLTPNPSLSIVKSGTSDFTVVPPNLVANAGDTISYTFTVTNTGNVTLSNVNISDTVGGITIVGSPIASMAPGASDSGTFTGSYTLTQANVDAGTFTNTATATGTPPIGPDTTDTDNDTQTLPPAPSIEIVKTGTLNMDYVAPNGIANVNDRVNYGFTVTNTGNVTLTNVNITDPGAVISGGPITLAPGASSTAITGYHSLTRAQIDAGTYTNTATVTGTTPAGPTVTDTDPDTQTWPRLPSITLAKTGTIVMTTVAPGTRVDVGDLITYAFTIINTGNVTLSNVHVTDLIPGVTVSGGPITLNAGATSNGITGSHTITQADIDAGTFYNNATVTGTPPAGAGTDVTYTDDDTRTLTAVPSVGIVKTGVLTLDVVAPAGIANAGDTIAYTITVTNTGNVTLTNLVVTDSTAGVILTGSPIASLAPGASNDTAYSAAYTLTQADIDAGTFVNTVNVTATPPIGVNVTNTDDDTQSLVSNPGITLEKTGVLNLNASAPLGVANPGDTITYSFNMTNTGNVNLSNVMVSDPDAIISGGPITTLAPGASNSTTFTGIYTVDQADVDGGTFTNIATVTGTPPIGVNVSDTDDDTKTLPPVASMTLVKSGTQNMGANSRIDVGETISYSFTITNTGNVTLDNIDVTDLPLTLSGGPLTLAPGASDSTSITGEFTLTQADIDACHYPNTASVDGETPQNAPVGTSDTFDTIFVTVPTINLVIYESLDPTIAGDVGDANAGDVINYTFTITNTGNVTLSNIGLTERTSGVTLNGGLIVSLAPGASNTTTFTGSYTLTQADVDAGTFVNEVRVDSTAPTCTLAAPTHTTTASTTLDANPSIELIKSSTINSGLVLPNGQADPGDVINYSFTISNTGNVTLSNVTLVDNIPSVVISGSPIVSLLPGAVDTTTITGTHTLIQADVDAGVFDNNADVSGTPPTGDDVTDHATDSQGLGDEPMLGVAKRVVGAPAEASPGIWNVTFEIYVRNYGNVTLNAVQVTDDIEDVFGTDPFTILSLTSSDFTVNPTYDGLTAGDTDLLAGTDSLVFEEDGIITLVVQVTPSSGGPFTNTAVGTATPPTGPDVTDDSHDGVNPDEDGDSNPTNDNDPTPVDFGANLFDPPFGMKVFDASGMPLMRWTMVWINDTNIVAINAEVSDPIPAGTVFQDTGPGTGIGLPLGAPDDSTIDGVSCTVGLTSVTTTTRCYYEGPTFTYPRGRIVWQGSLGPDLGVTDPALAINDLSIAFNVLVNTGLREVYNRATVNADLNGNGIFDEVEIEVDDAEETWSDWPNNLPITGFKPGVKTDLSERPMVTYANSEMSLEIPSLKVKAPIVGVPIQHGIWNLDWLGNDVGYLEGTSFPTWNGNSGLTAHNTDANGNPGLFANLETMRFGQEIIVHGWGQRYIYEVRSVKTMVEPKDSDVITHEKLPWLTLITCRGYDEKTDTYRWRVAVRAVLVRTEPE